MSKIHPKQIVLYTDGSFSSNSDLLIPSQKATKNFVINYVSNAPISELDYQTLKAFKDDASLVPGKNYLLANYKTKHVIPYTNDINEGDVEPLILFANSSTSFDIRAYSTVYNQDYIELDFDNILCEDNITEREGFITNRKDINRNLEAPYDFRNVKFRRWEIDTSDLEWIDTNYYNLGDVVLYEDEFYISLIDSNFSDNLDPSKWSKILTLSYGTSGDLGYYIIANPNEIQTIGTLDLLASSNTQDYYTFDDDCKNIIIKKSESLNNIVIKSNCTNITIDYDSTDITIIGNNHYINIGDNNRNLIFNSYCNNITTSSYNINSTFQSTYYLTTDVLCENNCFKSSYNTKIGIKNTQCYLVDNSDINMGNSNEFIIINDSYNINIGNSNASIFINNSGESTFQDYHYLIKLHTSYNIKYQYGAMQLSLNDAYQISFGVQCANIILQDSSHNIVFPDNFRNKTFNNSISNITILVPNNTATDTYIITDTDIVIDKKAPDGSLWYTLINNYGEIETKKLV